MSQPLTGAIAASATAIDPAPILSSRLTQPLAGHVTVKGPWYCELPGSSPYALLAGWRYRIGRASAACVPRAN